MLSYITKYNIESLETESTKQLHQRRLEKINNRICEEDDAQQA